MYNIYITTKKVKQKTSKKIKKMLDRIKKICYNNNIEKEKRKSQAPKKPSKKIKKMLDKKQKKCYNNNVNKNKLKKERW